MGLLLALRACIIGRFYHILQDSVPFPPGWSAVGPCVLSLAANRGVVVLSVWLGECPRVASSSATVNVALLSDWPSSLWGHFPHPLAPKLLALLGVWKVGCGEPLRLSV